MSKDTRSVSLPARPVLGGGIKKTSSCWKEKGGTQRREKDKETEENFGVSCLCFKTDLMTVVQRKQVMERQKYMADSNSEKEIEYVSNLINDLSMVWQEPEVTEILTRLAMQVLGLGSRAEVLATESGSLGSLRQELSYSKTVSVMVEYVDLLTERNSDVHEQLVNARKVLGENNIALEKSVDAEAEVTIGSKTRSVSLVSPAPTSRRVNYHEEERSKSVTEREILENNNGVRKKSKKCSMFATISELCDKDHEIPTDIKDSVVTADVLRKRRKSSKKVSIAENLNCDYSDTNISDDDSDNANIVSTGIDELGSNTCREDTSETLIETVCGVFQALLLSLCFLDCYIFHHPLLLIISGLLLLILVTSICFHCSL